MAKKFTVSWHDLDHLLPTSADARGKARRKELFDEYDPNGNGILAQAAVVRGVFRLFPRLGGAGGIIDMRPVLNMIFRVTRESTKPIVPISTNNIDRNQFRVFLVCLRSYLELSEAFSQTSNANYDQRFVSLRDVQALIPLFQKWQLQDTYSFLESLRADFKRLGRSDTGELPFDSFADCCLRRALPELSTLDEEAERNEAARLLTRTHPHLFMKEGENAAIPARTQISAPPAAPKAAQQLPRSVVLEEQALLGGNVTQYVWKQGKGAWATQYMNDFPMPQRRPGLVGSRSSQTLLNPHVAASAASMQPRAAPGLRHSQSAVRFPEPISPKADPDSPMRTTLRNLDKTAMRSRLENQMDMYTTGQMRSLLRAAGGIISSNP